MRIAAAVAISLLYPFCLLSAQGVAAKEQSTSFNPYTLSDANARETVSPSALSEQGASSLFDLIEGRVSGVSITPQDGAPGSPTFMNIRGVRSFRGSNEPLYVLDGVVLNPPRYDAAPTFWDDTHDYQSAQSTLDRINPNDIANIQILKDISATALYGSMGANGVVLITTKRGEGSNTTTWTSTVGLSFMAGKIKMLGADEYKNYIGLANPGYVWPFETGAGIDRQDEASRVALSQNHHLSLKGSGSTLSYYLSLGFDQTQGVVKGSDLQRTTVKMNVDRKIGKNNVIGTRILIGYRTNNMVQGTSPLGSPSMTKRMPSAMPLATPDNYYSAMTDNALDWHKAYDDHSTEYSVVPMVYFDASLVRGLKFNIVAGIDYRNKERLRWIGSEVDRGRMVDGQAGKTIMSLLKHNIESSFKYEQTFGRHAIAALAGGSLSGNVYNNNVHEGTTFFNQDLRGDGISLAENLKPYRNIESKYTSMAVFTNVSYVYNKKYSLSASLRADKTFRYDPSDDLTYYPAVAVSWNVSEEQFMKGQNIVSSLKLRAGWGKAGYQTLDPLSAAVDYITGVAPELTVENGVTNYYNIRWTSMSKQTNAGVDASFLDGRLMLSADIYRSQTKDKLRYYYHRRMGAWNSVYSNSASVDNRGVELAISGLAIDKKEMKWDVGFTFAYNKNKIVSTGSQGDVSGSSIGINNGQPSSVTVNRAGSPVGSFFGYHTQGIVDERHLMYAPPFMGGRLQPGDIKFVDTNGDGNVTPEDRTVIGNPIPKYVMGLYTTFNLKNFTVEALVESSLKFDVMNLNLQQDTYTSGNFSNLRTGTYRNAYPNGGAPRPDAVGVTEISSRIVEDASYLRLANISFGYKLKLGSAKWIDSLDFSLIARNLLVVTDYTGHSPRVNSYGYDLSRMGVDNGSYPMARTILVGIKATF